jgi:hypothetical protein
MDLNPAPPDVFQGPDVNVLAGGVLCVFVDVEAILGAQAKRHDGVGVVSKVVRLDLKIRHMVYLFVLRDCITRSSVLDPDHHGSALILGLLDPDLNWERIRKAKMIHKNRQKLRLFIF